jgi:hypothetical protein
VLVNQGRATAGESALNITSPTDTQQALYMLPQRDYNVIDGRGNGYTASSGYNLVTGLGTPTAGLLVPDLVAYQGVGTFYPGTGVAPLQVASLVDPTTVAGGPIDVFSVFDSFTVTSSGMGHAGIVGAAGENRVTAKADAPASRSAALTQPGASPIQNLAYGLGSPRLTALDSVIVNWKPAGRSMMKRLTPPVAGGMVSLDFGKGAVPAVNVGTMSPALVAGIVDIGVAGGLDISSLFAVLGQRSPSQRLKSRSQSMGVTSTLISRPPS